MNKILNHNISLILKVQILKTKYTKPKKVNKSINPMFNNQKHLIIKKTSSSLACMQNHFNRIIYRQN
jgi:hypothetical protein